MNDLRKLLTYFRPYRVSLFIGIACIIDDRERQNLRKGVAGVLAIRQFRKIGRHETVVLVHNDAVVQGLSEVPFMQDVEHWGILTIGTGLGNARFTNRSQADD